MKYVVGRRGCCWYYVLLFCTVWSSLCWADRQEFTLLNHSQLAGCQRNDTILVALGETKQKFFAETLTRNYVPRHAGCRPIDMATPELGWELLFQGTWACPPSDRVGNFWDVQITRLGNAKIFLSSFSIVELFTEIADAWNRRIFTLFPRASFDVRDFSFVWLSECRKPTAWTPTIRTSKSSAMFGEDQSPSKSNNRY